ncbi:MAG: hypothetical protein ABIN48_11175 [Ginsengibacter sp.]
MPIKIILFFLSWLFIQNGQSQITKGNWMVGGNGVLEKSKTINLFEVKSTNIKLSPNIGYFFMDKFAGGIKTGLYFSEIKFNGGVSKSTQFSLGPILRYYFLNADNMVNFFAESTYQYSHLYGNSGSSNNSNTWAFSLGPVIYFNSSVGLEFTINYESFRYKNDNKSSNSFFLGIGFQIHLERYKN